MSVVGGTDGLYCEDKHRLTYLYVRRCLSLRAWRVSLSRQSVTELCCFHYKKCVCVFVRTGIG